jgi:hypothetical protein
MRIQCPLPRTFWLLGFCCAFPAFGGDPGNSIVVTIDGDEVEVDISLTDGVETYQLDFDLHFDDVDNLTEACLGISAELLDAGQQAAINARLPRASQTIATEFPVVVRVEPPAACGLAFRGDVDIDFHTDEHVVFTPGSGYRFFKGPVDGALKDITGIVGAGSIRTRGRSGRFSEFLLGFEANQDYHQQVAESLFELRNLLEDPTIAAAAGTVLALDLDLAEAAYQTGNFNAAATHVLEFEAHVDSLGGVGIPNSWQASVAGSAALEGEILGSSGPLAFALARLGGAP